MPPPEADSGSTERGLQVLVVDDNRDAARLLSKLIESLGHEVRVANTGQQGVEIAAEFRPQVIFMDIGMPGMDGFEAARRIRQQPAGRDVLLVALTGWGQNEDRRRTKEAGFDHHLVKPVDQRALRNLLVKVGESAGSPRT